MYPGWWVAGWVAGVAIPGTTQPAIPGPNISIFKAISPTHGQMKAILEVSQILTSELTRIDPQIDPDMTLR